jgi:N-acetylmuramoyl-L-alanine amidase
LVLAFLALLVASGGAGASPAAGLPSRVHRIVLHTLGGPFYGNPAMRFAFLSPPATFRLWARPSFGAHWIVWTDGSLWPRQPRPGDPPSVIPPVDAPLSRAWRERLAREAAPVYAHVQGANRDSVGIELSHSGRSTDPFPAAQIRTVAWLVRSLLAMSGGRLSVASVAGHKDLDDTPAYVVDGCRGPGCAYYVDAAGRPYRRRVDPPESLFDTLAQVGLRIPRGSTSGDAPLERALALGPATIPAVVRP